VLQRLRLTLRGWVVFLSGTAVGTDSVSGIGTVLDDAHGLSHPYQAVPDAQLLGGTLVAGDVAWVRLDAERGQLHDRRVELGCSLRARGQVDAEVGPAVLDRERDGRGEG
jgi:hypothetical protein